MNMTGPGAALLGVIASVLSSIAMRQATPASVALLVLDARSDEGQRRLTEALRDQQPAVRAVAARVAAVTSAREQTAALIDALARESDPLAAREQVRALLATGGPERNAVVGQAVDRIGGLTATVLAEAVARTRGADVLAFLPMLAEKGRDPNGLADVLTIVLLDHAVEHARISLAVIQTGDMSLWRSWQERLASHKLVNDDGTRLAALRSPSAAIRADSIFKVADWLVQRLEVRADLVDAARPPAAWPPASPTEEDLARELVARASRSRPSAADWASVLVALGQRLPDSLRRLLTDAEADARKRAGLDGRRKGSGDLPRLNTDWKPTGGQARTAPPLALGLLTELTRLTGCEPGRPGEYAAAEVTYHSDGRPKGVVLGQQSVRKGCERFISAVMLLSVARVNHALKANPTEIVFLPLEREMLACLDSSSPGVAPVSFGEPGLTPPNLTHEEKPQYTRRAMEDRAQGSVRLTAVVSDRGCISQAEVTGPLHPGLDLQALDAVLQWRFEAGRRAGQAVPVEISVEVGFRLK
jgi:TonB family protein